jgi:hypothetical protein
MMAAHNFCDLILKHTRAQITLPSTRNAPSPPDGGAAASNLPVYSRVQALAAGGGVILTPTMFLSFLCHREWGTAKALCRAGRPEN